MGHERRVVATIFWGLVALFLIFPVGLWASLALWFRIPGAEWARAIGAAAFGLVSLWTLVALFSARRWPALGVFGLAFGAVLLWWGTIKPAAEADWSPDVARQVTGIVDGDSLTLKNVRDFEWTGPTEFKQRWVSETYDLARLRELDLFLAYWAGPEMTHLIMSFGFDGGQWLAWSVEVRSRKGGEFSPIGDLFRSNPLVIIASDERDVVRLRSNIRGEDVQLYRLRTPPDVARMLLLQYVDEANALAKQPEFYNSIMTNCTTAVVKLIRAAGGHMPFDWRLIVNGYLPSYLYDRGAVDTRMSLEELRARARISARARKAGDPPNFSTVIREGVPSPLQSADRP
ncbi:lipoprotein N-acyltransferase Lnb domain-containing protein [Rhodoblastus sp.]|uniref:Lnb N-terminal periplasmic domain-containing protein n=1 Tax=Rhodoblastus sp. TaxID=1962975 RepID=UPI003F9C4DEC